MAQTPRRIAGQRNMGTRSNSGLTENDSDSSESSDFEPFANNTPSPITARKKPMIINNTPIIYLILRKSYRLCV